VLDEKADHSKGFKVFVEIAARSSRPLGAESKDTGGAGGVVNALTEVGLISATCGGDVK